MAALDAHDLFKADALCMEAGSLFIRAVTAGEHGRSAEQRGLVAQAADRLAKALALLSPANDTHEPTPPTDPVGARMERAA